MARDHLFFSPSFFFFNDTATTEIYTLSLHDALPIFGIPSQNTALPVVGYLGVLPEHRGHGYADEILDEITRILVAEAGATKIHADTDLANRPMAAAFARAGYVNIGRRLVLSAG